MKGDVSKAELFFSLEEQILLSTEVTWLRRVYSHKREQQFPQGY